MSKLKTKYTWNFKVLFNAFGFAIEAEENEVNILLFIFVITITSSLE